MRNYEMTYPVRKRMRMEGMDYSRGVFFVSQVTQFRQLLFGKIIDGIFSPAEEGKMVERWWRELEQKFPNVVNDEWVLMPDHLQGILVLGYESAEEAIGRRYWEGLSPEGQHNLSSVMQWFKTQTTNEYIRKVKEGMWAEFEQKVWQRSFHDSIIRDKNHLENVRTYIKNNPKNWTPRHEGVCYKKTT